MGLDTFLPQIGAYHAKAVEIAAAIKGIDGIEVMPDPPQTNMLHIFMRGDADRLKEAIYDIAEETGTMLVRTPQPGQVPGWQKSELSVGSASLDVPTDEIAALFADLIARAVRPVLLAGAAPLLFRDHISVPTIPALARARHFLDRRGVGRDVTLIITGGLGPLLVIALPDWARRRSTALAVKVGGASLAGGRGRVISTLIGALIIVVVQNGLNLNAVTTSMQSLTIGLIILIAVGLDVWRSRIGAVFSGLGNKRRSAQIEVAGE